MKSRSLYALVALIAAASLSVACSDSFEDEAPKGPDGGIEGSAGGSGGGTGGVAGTGGDAGTGGTAGTGGDAGTGGTAGVAGSSGAAGIGGGGTGGTQPGGAGGEDAGPGGWAGESGSAGVGPGGTAGADAGPCPSGYDDCDGDDSNGCETALGTTDNCGTCGQVCGVAHATASCESFVCSLACDGNYEDCDGNNANGCETPLGTMENCGSCGDGCISPANATAACESLSCSFACTGTYDDCDGSAANGCEIDIASNPTHCGSCANACPSGGHGTATCNNSTCGIDCATDWDNCDGQLANGCEVSLATDAANCGSCGNVCPDRANATKTCSSGLCGFTCDAGWADCDGNAGNGCEANLATSATNCGGCGQACGTAHGTPSCSGGTCSITCATGYGDCDGVNANGCEINLTNTKQDCGTCGRDCLNGTCSASQCTAWQLVTSSSYSERIAVNATHVYWTQSNGVYRVSINGGTAQLVATTTSGRDIALDSTHVYWTRPMADTGGIYRAPLAGGAAETVAANQNYPGGLAVDGSNVYWGHSNGVRRKSKTFTTISDLVTSFPNVWALTTDDTKVFFLNNENPGKLAWTTKATGGTVTNLMWNQQNPSDVVQEGDWVYFTKMLGDVHRIGKDGYGTLQLASGYTRPTGITVSGEYVFFTDVLDGLVVQVRKTGGTAITRNSGGMPYPIRASNGIIYWADLNNNRIYAMVE